MTAPSAQQPVEDAAPASSTPPSTARFCVIMPSYNCRPYIARALDSVLAQSGNDTEIVVIDDGSTDGTAEVVEKYAGQVRYLRQEHADTFTAFRNGYRTSNAPFMIPVDADDELRPGALEALRAAADAHPNAKLIFGRARTIFADGRIVEDRRPPMPADPQTRFAKFATGEWRTSIAGALVHRDMFGPYNRTDLVYPHSTDLAVLGYSAVHECVSIDAFTLDIHVRPGRLRDNTASILRSGTSLVDLLFDHTELPPWTRIHRAKFLAYVQRERSRAFHRAGWHGASWRAFASAVAADPRTLFDTRNLRRALVSAAKSLFSRVRPPARMPRAHWFYGHHRKLWKDSLNQAQQWAATHGTIVQLRLHNTTFLLTDPADVRHLLLTNKEAYRKATILQFYQVLAGGLIGIANPQHREVRRHFAGPFKRTAIPDLGPMLGPIIERHTRAWPCDTPFDVALACKRLVGEMAAGVTFGPADIGESERLMEWMRITHGLAAREMRRWPRPPRWLLTKFRRRYPRLQAQLDTWLAPRIEKRKSADAPGDDLLTMLIAMQPEANKDQIRDLAFTFFLAGFEPVSVTIPWALQLLAEHPQIQERAAAEVAQVVSTRPPTAADIPNLRYLDQILQEVLRFYPSEWLITRHALADDVFPSGLKLRKGEEVMVSPYIMQRDARFFPNPDQFNPDRFAQPPELPIGVYFPFGLGTRVCIGEYLARLQICLTLAHVLQRYHIVQVQPSPPQESPNLFSTQPLHGSLTIQLRAR